MKKPNLFVIGAPKCGTSSLCRYLEAHPRVLFSTPKEPNYFCSDVTGAYCSASTERDYLSLCFPRDFEQYDVVGDGSVSSLYSESAVPKILSFNADAKFIVMIRNPVDLVYSLHGQLLLNAQEDVELFSDAWHLQENRKRGMNIPKYCLMPGILQYGEVGKLGAQLDRLLSRVSLKQVHIVLFDDLTSDPEREYIRTLKFLELPLVVPTSFPIINESQRRRSNVLEEVLRSVQTWKQRLNLRTSFGVVTWLSRANIEPYKRKPLSPDFSRELLEFFADDIQRLSGIIQRDLSHWTR